MGQGFGGGSLSDPETGKRPDVTPDGELEVIIKGPLESNGAIPVNVQDQHSRAFDLFFAQDVGSPTSLTTDVVLDAYTISVATGHGLVQEDFFVMFDPVSQRGWSGVITAVDGDNIVNVDRPVSHAFPSASTVVQKRSIELNVDGSETPQTFKVGGSLLALLDITRIMLQITTETTPSWDEFGDIAVGPTFRGIQFRLVNGDIIDLWNAKTTGELAHLMYDITVYEGGVGLTVDGIAGRMTYAGQEKHGVTLRIGANEALEVIIQDDLSELGTFRMIACGHFVTD
jgi:hypothetical protein